MNERTILVFLALVAISFLGIGLANQISPGLIPGLASPTPSVTGAPLEASDATATCNADPEPNVVLKAPLIVGNYAFELANYPRSGLLDNKKSNITVDINGPVKDYFRVKKGVHIKPGKIDPLKPGAVRSGHFIVFAKDTYTPAAENRGDGSDLLWTYASNKAGGGTRTLWPIIYDRIDKAGSQGRDSGIFDIYILKELVDKLGGLPGFMSDPSICAGGKKSTGGGNPVLTEENCGVDASATSASQSASLKFSSTNFVKDTTGNYDRLKSSGDITDAYAFIQEEDFPDDGAEILIGTYTNPTTSTLGRYNVYYHSGSIYLRVGNQQTALLYDQVLDSAGLPATASASPATGGFYLCTIKFAATSQTWSWFTPVCKPAVYLYPERKTLVNVKVTPKGELLYTDPKYPEGGWSTTAYPDGRLSYQGKDYDYLYYEAKIASSELPRPSQGWVVNYSDLPKLYDETLPKLGFNTKEASQFKEYWEKYLPKKDKYFVGLINQETINRVEPLTITPTPDNVNRIRFHFSPAKEGDHTNPPTLTSVNREGFDVMDWGGVVEGVEGFSCVQ